ncbi:hypothetical protein EWM64_g2900 [Hericium alpestre]|uniref:Uncharacterized protein n=1 Tax=Hericium alpestre TaxID=135208 RepID=A0A4Z0A2Y5_9AGAM|nr:hypothetical protein EWM64_g2900 [Hericium alpestre]
MASMQTRNATAAPSGGPTPSQTPSQKLFDKISQSEYFLGSPTLRSKVKWVMDSKRVCKLVERSSGLNGEPPVEAEIWWIGQILPDNFGLFVEGSWSPSYGAKFSFPLEQSKARCYVAEPDDPTYASVWRDTFKGAKALEASRRTPRAEEGDNRLVYDIVGGDHALKLRFSVFEKHDNAEKYEEARAEQEENCPEDAEELLMQNWECRREDTQEALNALIQSNETAPPNKPRYLGHALPVWTAEHTRVLPRDYESKLLGATAVFGAHISHRTMTERDLKKPVRKDHYFADITSIIVLDDAPPDPVSQARKRGFEMPPHLVDDSEEEEEPPRRSKRTRRN